MSDPNGQIKMSSTEAAQRLGGLLEGGLEKQAESLLTSYVRVRNRESSFLQQILPPQMISNSELERSITTDKPVVILEYEPENPPPVSVPFVSNTMTRYIRGRRFQLVFQRIQSPNFTKNVDELRTYKGIDIRQVISDNALKDIQTEEDSKFIGTINSLLQGPGLINPDTGVVQWTNIAGGITRDTFTTARQVMPTTDAVFAPTTVLMNIITIQEFEKWGRDELGGDMAEQVARNGWVEKNFGGMRMLVTIKRNLVPDNRMYFFAQSDVVGRYGVLTDVTMHVKTDGAIVEFYAYKICGAVIANSSAITIADYV